jgi:exopolysaccharide biosynthesis polyprenyl glycosylphosphotransferase
MDGLYRPSSLGKCHGYSRSLLKAAIWAVLFSAGLVFITGESHTFILQALLVSAGLHFTLIAALCALRNKFSRNSNHTKDAERRVVIVGTGRTALKLGSRLIRETDRGVNFEGFVNDRGTEDGDRVKILGGIADLQRLVQSHFLDEVIVCLPDEPAAARRAVFVARRLPVDVKVVAEAYGCIPMNDGIEKVGDIPLLTLQEREVHELRALAKRGLDLAVGASTLLLLTPVLAAIALLVKLDSPGPGLYRAPRVGRKGRLFLCYKFRTMHLDADRQKQSLRTVNERSGPFFKLKHDPRVTRIGAYLRRYSLDELPQLWNVVLGDMSLVGPRPHPLDDHAHYAPEHFQRLAVTPGLTGLWQVTARNDPSFERNMALDCEYIEQQSLRMDLWILLRTVREVALGSGV